MDPGPVGALVAEWMDEAGEDCMGTLPMDRRQWQPLYMLRARAYAFFRIDIWLGEDMLPEHMEVFELSPGVLSSEEAALLAQAREEQRPSVEERVTPLWDPDMSLLAFALLAAEEADSEEASTCSYLLELCHERGTLARDMAAPVPGVVTPECSGGTAFHLAVGVNASAVVQQALALGVDPDAQPPFLGAHSPLCWAAMTDSVQVLEVLLEYYKGHGRLKEVLVKPCCTLTAAQAEERRNDPLPVLPPYSLIIHAIEHGALEVFHYLFAKHGHDSIPWYSWVYRGRTGMSIHDVCVMNAWRPGLELLIGLQQLPALSEEEAFILFRAQEEAPDFICPLVGRIMQQVALASDGFSYERAAIEAHIERCKAAGRAPVSPKTGEPIDPMLLPNLSLRNLIETFVEEQRRAFAALLQDEDEMG